MFSFSKQQKVEDVTPEGQIKRIKVLEEELLKAQGRILAVEDLLGLAVTKIGVVRFNPFRELGGDQSFSIALLNQDNTGIVVTSHYSKELNRMYAKEVQKGTSQYSLSEEEREAISKATRI